MDCSNSFFEYIRCIYLYMILEVLFNEHVIQPILDKCDENDDDVSTTTIMITTLIAIIMIIKRMRKVIRLVAILLISILVRVKIE